jgi:homoserine dehydrogenase
MTSQVGASLPLISKLRQIVNGGDTVHLIRGALSASVGWVLHRCCPVKGGAPEPPPTLLEAVLEAEARGLLERDVQQDGWAYNLSGAEMATKVRGDA